MDVYPLSHVSLVEVATEWSTTALILMMGETQSGKTKLMNLLSRSDFATGDGCGSCTQNIQISRPFEYGGRTVRIIDTPGFEHTCRTEKEILGDLASLLADIHKARMYIQGIVYVHSLSSKQYMSIIAMRAFTLLGLMCGPRAMGNVLVVTTSKSRHMAESERFSREAKLRGATSPFKDHLDKISFFSHTKGTLESARIILTHALDKMRPSTALLIQEEMNIGRKEFAQTTLGNALTFGMEMDPLCQAERKTSTLQSRRSGSGEIGHCIQELRHCSHHPRFNHRHQHHCGHQHQKVAPLAGSDQTGGQGRKKKPTRHHLQPATVIESRGPTVPGQN